MLDTNRKFFKDIRSVGKNTKIITEDKIIETMFSFDKDGDIKEINFINEIPTQIIDMVNGEFENKYDKNPDGYVIIVNSKITVYSLTKQGLFLGAYCVLRNIENNQIREQIIYNYPVFPFRGVKVYIPSRKDIDYFKQFVDFCAYYGYNKITIEVGGAMEYENHKEINDGWVEYCKLFSHYQGESLDIQNQPNWARNSIHCENGGGSFLTKKELRELINYCKDRHFEVIPEVPSLSHCDYLLVNHPELRERKEDDLPDTYCPSNPKSYELLFDLLEEIIEVFEPTRVNIGHDEYFSVGLCEKCKGRDAGELYAYDVNKIYEFLKEKNIKTALWGDKLLNAIGKMGQTWGGSRRVIVNMRTNKFLEEVPPTYHAIDLISRDVEIYHWYWGLNKNWEMEFLNRGFKTIMGNFSGLAMTDWKKRSKNGYSGVCISNWSRVSLEHMQRNATLTDIAYGAYMMWGGDFSEENFQENCLQVAHNLYDYNLKSHKNYIEVIHRTDLLINHPPFVDGFMIDKNDDYLGKYEITFKSGKTMDFNIYYNLNIGTQKCSFAHTASAETENNDFDKQIFESVYTCDIVLKEDGIFYKTAIEIPENETVNSITLVQDSKYGSNIFLKSVNHQ